MSTATVQLEAGGLLPAKTKVDAGATEQVVARTYRHPALGERPVVRLASDRLGQAEDLAMEFLGFEAPAVSAPVAVQQHRSLGFAAWALTNDPANARFALDLVKRMKKATRLARSKPGHAWDAYMDMAKDLGRSARHFLPPFWEEVGRTFKDQGNQAYAGRALTKSLEAERVHALESDRARRRDVVLEFVLSGCLAGAALSDYGNDLLTHYSPDEAFAIFRDLCDRRTRGGMAPWATLPRDFTRLAKAAGLNADGELEKWLEEVIDTPAMGRPPHQFWKSCSGHCKRIVARNPAFAVALLRHTQPAPRYYGENKLWPWLELLEEWGVFEFLWEDEHRGAPPLGEPIARWFGRVVSAEVPAPRRTLEMLEKIAPRLKKEGTPLPAGGSTIDIDVLEACHQLNIKIDDPSPNVSVTFEAWLSATVDHPLRNQDIVAAAKDERFEAAIFKGLDEALTCRGGAASRGYRRSSREQRAFPLAAGDRPGIKELWHRHLDKLITRFEKAGLASFESARGQLESTLWPDAIRLFPDLAERLNRIDPVDVLVRTLQAGVFDEYGLPALEKVADQHGITIRTGYRDTNIFLTFPWIVLTDKVHAYIIAGDGTTTTRELRLPAKSDLMSVIVVGDDLAVIYRDENYQGHFHWVSDPSQTYDCSTHHGNDTNRMGTVLGDGSVFQGGQAVRSGDKQLPTSQQYLHDGERFWRVGHERDPMTGRYSWKVAEVDPQTGRLIRESVPPWFEETEGGVVEWNHAELLPAPPGAEDSPLGNHDGMLGWKTITRGDGSRYGQGFDGRNLTIATGVAAVPVGLLNQPGTEGHLAVTRSSEARSEGHWIWDPSGATVIAKLQDFATTFAEGQVTVLPLHFWHLLKVRDEESSKKLRAISKDACAALFKTATADREAQESKPDSEEWPLTKLLPAVRKLLPTAPDRLALGVARIVQRAEDESAAFLNLRDRANADSTKEAGSSSLVVNRKSDLAAAQWGLQSFSIYGRDGDVSVSGHLAAVAAFLKGETKAGDLPRSNYLWFAMLEDLPLRCWQTYWRATAARMGQKDNSEVPWLEFLKLWHELGIAELPGQLDLMEGYPKGAQKRSYGGYEVSVIGGKAYSLKNGADLFVVMENDSYQGDRYPHHFLRYSTAKTPGNPPGYEVVNVRKVKAKADLTEVAAFIAAVETATALPLPSKDELAEVAGNLSVSPAEVGLIWMGGLNLDSYQNNFLPAELRSALGWKAAEAGAARQALRNLNSALLPQLYQAVLAEGLAAPFAADRRPVLQALETAWKEKLPKRLPLDAALQKRLAELGKIHHWQSFKHEELLAVAAEPATHKLLQPTTIEIKVNAEVHYRSLHLAGKTPSDHVVSGDFLRSIVQLVALVHAETPAGYPARSAMPALIKQTTRLLDHSGVLLDLRTVTLYDHGRKKPLTPVEWLNKHLGKTRADAKDGTTRFDDGLLVGAALDGSYQAFVAFRPAKLKDEGDLARLHGIEGLELGEESRSLGGFVPIVAVIKSPGFQKLAKAIVAKGTPAGQWPQNPTHTAAAVVDGIRKKHKLGSEAAALYAQLLALPEPTTANICAWNGWTAGQLKKASAELVDRKLVLEATRARAGRGIFLPGEWLELKAPWLPVESWKLGHLVELDLNPRQPCPAGGPMVLRPFEDLFAAVWQRVLDGDAPRYEEAKRKKKK